MKIADLRIQTSTPTAPSVGVVGLYANASGIPVTINSAGTVVQVGASWISNIATASVISTGIAGIPGGTASVPAIQSGIFLGVTVSGINYCFPVFKYS